MCEFKEVLNYYDLTPDQQRRFDAHARGEDGTECQHCRGKYFEQAFYQPAKREAWAYPQA